MLNVNIYRVWRKNSPDAAEILQNISFQVGSGNIYTITGKNGSGKTTLLKSISVLINKKYFDVEGEVFYKNDELFCLAEEKLNTLRKKEIKYIFQDPVLSFNPLKKLTYYFEILNEDTNALDKLLKEFLLPSRNQLGSMHSYELSGGMAQRLAIVLALSAGPDLILLDEPNSGIDEETSVIISKALKKYTKEKNAVVLMVTQDLDFALQISDYYGFMSKGRFKGFFNQDEFLNPPVEENDFHEFIAAYKSL